MNRVSCALALVSFCIPHGCGDEPVAISKRRCFSEYSPRMWGALVRYYKEALLTGVFPTDVGSLKFKPFPFRKQLAENLVLVS